MGGWAITPKGEYPVDWAGIAGAVKDAAKWECVRCKAPHSRDGWRILTVHHLDGDKANCRWWNLLALCQCYERVRSVIAWGGEPYCQPVLPLNYLGGDYRPRHDWTLGLLRDFARYANRYVWRSVPLSEYADRKGEPPPFRDFAWAHPKAVAA